MCCIEWLSPTKQWRVIFCSILSDDSLIDVQSQTSYTTDGSYTSRFVFELHNLLLYTTQYTSFLALPFICMQPLEYYKNDAFYEHYFQNNMVTLTVTTVPNFRHWRRGTTRATTTQLPTEACQSCPTGTTSSTRSHFLFSFLHMSSTKSRFCQMMDAILLIAPW